MREKQVPNSRAGSARREWKKFFFFAIQSHSRMCAIRIIAKNYVFFSASFHLTLAILFVQNRVFFSLSSLVRRYDASPLVVSVNCPSAKKAWNLFVQSFHFFHFHSLSLSIATTITIHNNNGNQQRTAHLLASLKNKQSRNKIRQIRCKLKWSFRWQT